MHSRILVELPPCSANTLLERIFVIISRAVTRFRLIRRGILVLWQLCFFGKCVRRVCVGDKRAFRAAADATMTRAHKSLVALVGLAAGARAAGPSKAVLALREAPARCNVTDEPKRFLVFTRQRSGSRWFVDTISALGDGRRFVDRRAARGRVRPERAPRVAVSGSLRRRPALVVRGRRRPSGRVGQDHVPAGPLAGAGRESPAGDDAHEHDARRARSSPGTEPDIELRQGRACAAADEV